MRRNPRPFRFTADDPATARRYVHTTLVDLHHDGVVDDAELLVSELVTNAIVHGGVPSPAIVVSCDDDTVRIDVRDASPVPLVRSAKVDLTVPGGFGLGIVDTIAARWGVEHGERGKSVWFELDDAIAVN